MQWLEAKSSWLQNIDEHRSAAYESETFSRYGGYERNGPVNNLLKDDDSMWNTGTEPDEEHWVLIDMKDIHELDGILIRSVPGAPAPKDCRFQALDERTDVWRDVVAWYGDDTGNKKEINFTPRRSSKWKLIISSTFGEALCIHHLRFHGRILGLDNILNAQYSAEVPIEAIIHT